MLFSNHSSGTQHFSLRIILACLCTISVATPIQTSAGIDPGRTNIICESDDCIVIEEQRLPVETPEVPVEVPGIGGGLEQGGETVGSGEVGAGGEPVEVALGLASKSDVRCNALVAANSMNIVTSLSNLSDRQFTAQLVFRSLNIYEKRAAVQGGFLRLTYADGGTEDWVMPAPQFSNGGIDEPVPGSLKIPSEGAGVPKENKVCTKPV